MNIFKNTKDCKKAIVGLWGCVNSLFQRVGKNERRAKANQQRLEKQGSLLKETAELMRQVHSEAIGCQKKNAKLFSAILDHLELETHLERGHTQVTPERIVLRPKIQVEAEKRNLKEERGSEKTNGG